MPRRLSARERVEASLPESDVLEAVLEAAQIGGWLAAHHPDSRMLKGCPGLPDIVLAHPERGVLWAEVKTRRGRMTGEQTRWAATLMAAGAEWRLVRPADLQEMIAFLACGKDYAEFAPGRKLT